MNFKSLGIVTLGLVLAAGSAMAQSAVRTATRATDAAMLLKVQRPGLNIPTRAEILNIRIEGTSARGFRNTTVGAREIAKRNPGVSEAEIKSALDEIVAVNKAINSRVANEAAAALSILNNLAENNANCGLAAAHSGASSEALDADQSATVEDAKDAVSALAAYFRAIGVPADEAEKFAQNATNLVASADEDAEFASPDAKVALARGLREIADTAPEASSARLDQALEDGVISAAEATKIKVCAFNDSAKTMMKRQGVPTQQARQKAASLAANCDVATTGVDTFKDEAAVLSTCGS